MNATTPEQKQEKLIAEFTTLKQAIKEFIKECPDFAKGQELAGNIGRATANVETTLHWDFGVWELGLPE